MGRKNSRQQGVSQPDVYTAATNQQQAWQPQPDRQQTYHASYDQYHAHPPSHCFPVHQQAHVGMVQRPPYAFNPQTVPVRVTAAYNPPAVPHQMGPCLQGPCPPFTHQPLYDEGRTVHYGSHLLGYHQFHVNTAPAFSAPPGHYIPPAIEPQAQPLVGQPGSSAPYQPCPCCEQSPYPREPLIVSQSTSQPSTGRLSSASSNSYGAANQCVPVYREFSCSSPSDLAFMGLNLDSPCDPASVNMIAADAASFRNHADWGSQSVSSPSSIVAPMRTNRVEKMLDVAGRHEALPVVELSERAIVSDNRAPHHVRCQQLAPKALLSCQFIRKNETAQSVATTSRGGRGKVAIQPHPREERTHSPRLKCPQCDKVRDGFGGQAELDRHMATQHTPSEKWICFDPDSLETGKLSKCHHCRYKKLYAREDNAASHLRRMHFNKRQNGAGNQHRGGKSGGSQPSLKELKEKNCLQSRTIDDPQRKWLGQAPPPRKRRRSQRSSCEDSGSAQNSEDGHSEAASPEEMVALDTNTIDTNFTRSSFPDASGPIDGPEELSSNSWYDFRGKPGYEPRYNLGRNVNLPIPSIGVRGSATFCPWSDEMQQQFVGPNVNDAFQGQAFGFEGMDDGFDWANIDLSNLPDLPAVV